MGVEDLNPGGRGDTSSSGPVAAPRRRSLLWGAAIALFWLLVFAGLVLASGAVWVRRTFGPLNVDQLLMNLPGGEGAGGALLIWSAVSWILLLPAAVVLVLALLTEKSRRVLRRDGWLRGWKRRLIRGVAVLLALAVPAAGAAGFGATVGVGNYLQSALREARGEPSLADYYVAPRPELSGGGGLDADGRGGERRNLIVVYLESIESAFSDEQLFGRDLLEPVADASAGWESIPSLRQYEGGGWTMSGIVSTQCGIPLRDAGSVSDNFDLNLLGSEGHEVSSYLPGAVCLGDVLHDAGYTSVFMGGADERFAGKGAYFATHGYDEVYDLNHWREQGETEVREDWGLSDRRLFERAKDEVTRLHDSEQPFNLTLLTLDTHEGPRVYEYCDWDAESEAAMAAITSCSMEQVAGFVDYLDEQGYLADTTVVLMGDHLKMIAEGGSFWEELRDLDDRTVYNRIWSPDGARIRRDDIDQFSMYPTLLELAGIELPGHRAGLGVSALAREEDLPSGSMLELGDEEYRAVVQSRASEFYRELWSGS